MSLSYVERHHMRPTLVKNDQVQVRFAEQERTKNHPLSVELNIEAYKSLSPGSVPRNIVFRL